MLVSPAEAVLDWEPQLSWPIPELLVRRGGIPVLCCSKYCSHTSSSATLPAHDMREPSKSHKRRSFEAATDLQQATQA